MITARQHSLLSFVHAYLREHGISPTYTEMAAAVGLRSKSGVVRMLRGLEERGMVRRLPGRARAVEVIRGPGAVVPLPPAQHGLILIDEFVWSRSLVRPLRPVWVPAAMAPHPDQHFLAVVGTDAMIDAGLLPTDRAISRRVVWASNHDIVLVEADGEAMIRRVRQRGASIALEAANPSVATRIFDAARVRFIGRLVGILRSYDLERAS